MKKIAFSFLLALFALIFQSTVTYASVSDVQCIERRRIYQPVVQNGFGQHVIRQPGWDRYVMFFSSTATMKNGRLSSESPGDPGTYNSACNTWWADRIWYTWHFGDGKEPSGWDASDGYGNIPPFLAIDIGGQGESALVGDPSVIYWNGQYHMYYEGTDRCDGWDNRIFHATASSIFGPWTKRGEVPGLTGSHNGSGLSWPNVFTDAGRLHLYYTDGAVRLYAATAINTTGHDFTMENNNSPIIPDPVNEADIRKVRDRYVMVYEGFNHPGIKITESTNKFNFPNGVLIMDKRPNGWEDIYVSLPSLNTRNEIDGTEDRIYYGSAVAIVNNTPRSGINVCTVNLDLIFSSPTPTPKTTPLPTPSPTLTPSPSPSFSVTDLKTLLTNYGTDQELASYKPQDGIVNMLDAGYLMQWIH